MEEKEAMKLKESMEGSVERFGEKWENYVNMLHSQK